MAPKPPIPEPASPSSSSAGSSEATSDGEQEEEVSPSPSLKEPNNLASSVPQAKPSQPSSESSEEEEEEEEDNGDDDEDSGDDDEGSGDGDATNKKQPQPQPQPPPKATPDDSDSSSGDESDSSSDNPPTPARGQSRGADPSIKPISSKPIDEAPKPQKSAVPPIPTPSQDHDSHKLKRKAPEASQGDGGGDKRLLFQRIWSEDDVVAVLRGIIEYHSKKGSDPSSSLDMDAFHDFIRRSLQAEVSKSQLADKIWRLKKKYAANAARREEGTEPPFTKPHDRLVHELSKKIWGPKRSIFENGDANGDINGDGHAETVPVDLLGKVNGQTSMSTDGDEEVEVAFPLLREAVFQMSKSNTISLVPMKVLKSIESSKARMVEEKLLKVRLTEMKLDIRHMDLMKEAIKLLMDALAKSTSSSG